MEGLNIGEKGNKMKRKLTNEEIDTLASQPNVRKNAVVNFLMSLPKHTSYSQDLGNLVEDTKRYRWNDATQFAIHEGIKAAWDGELDDIDFD